MALTLFASVVGFLPSGLRSRLVHEFVGLWPTFDPARLKAIGTVAGSRKGVRTEWH
jgi:hypothetical protein